MHPRKTEATDAIIEQMRELDPREMITIAQAIPGLVAEHAAIRSTEFAVGDKVTYVKPGTGGKVIIEATVMKHRELGNITVVSTEHGVQTMSSIYLRAAGATV